MASRARGFPPRTFYAGYARTPIKKQQERSDSLRIRNKNIPIRVTEKELEIIGRKAAKAKLSRTDFLVAAALGKEITLMEDLKPILTELRRIGNNVNQLTKLANAGAVRVVGLQDLTEALGEIHVALMRIALHRKEDAVADSEADPV